jgi:hypothetical protein
MKNDLDIKFEEWLNNYHLFFDKQIESCYIKDVSLLYQKDSRNVVSKAKLCDLR